MIHFFFSNYQELIRISYKIKLYLCNTQNQIKKIVHLKYRAKLSKSIFQQIEIIVRKICQIPDQNFDLNRSLSKTKIKM